MSDWEFIFDGIFGFINSPLWNVPILSFIESQSVVFEESEENHLNWTEIHNKYKTLVESLLGGYLKDVGITEDQFLNACTSPPAKNDPQVQMVLHHLLACDDFEVFKKMMIEKNMELQIQALNLIKQRQGKDVRKEQNSQISSEDEILKKVMQKSLLEYEESQQKKGEDNAEFDISMEEILSKIETVGTKVDNIIEVNNDHDKSGSGDEVDSQLVIKESKLPFKVTNTPYLNQSASIPTTSKTVTSTSAASTLESSSTTTLLPTTMTLPSSTPQSLLFAESTSKKCETPESAAALWISNAKQESELISQTPLNKQININHEKSNEDMKKRELYLKQQRDRLLAMKNEERKKQLSLYTSNSQSEHPITSKAANNAVSGHFEKQFSEEDEKKVAIRRALAEKLKKEVINK
ncbi:cilia- and flagella-associated protein 36 isoform X1 [Hydra vulgaris]|uniref:cilia- and flagella-associated protein 36 isoform X1 n=1 Tax=Hydra vulgaris TaxID=6087 RepID=UPI001F5F7246|nr:cilia- and flagella-associated protein 36 [Hydra vulgaris]